MKKIKYILIIFCLFLLCGCSFDKNKLDSTIFLEIMNNHKYKVINYSNSYDIYKILYTHTSNVTSIKYLTTVNKNDINGIFLDECNNAINSMEEGYSKKSNSGDDWASLRLEDNKYIVYIEYVDDSMIYIKSTINNKDDILDLIKEFDKKR